MRSDTPRPSPLLLLAGLLALLALAAGCGSDDDTVTAGADGDETTDEGQPRPIDLDALTASTWTLRFGGGPDGDVPIVDGWPITITFDAEGTFGGTAACNGYGGTYTIDGSGLTLGEIGWTEMGCQPDVQASEAAFLPALLDVDGIDLIEDQLALSGMSTELLFGPTEPAPVDELTGRLWLLEVMISDRGETAVGGEPATLRLDADGTFTGGTGCRSISGEYVVTGNEVLFTSWGAEGDCPTALFDQDSSVVAVAEGGFVPEVDGETLTITSVGNEGLRYRLITEDELAGLTGTPVASDAELLDGIEWVFVGGDSAAGPIADPRTVDPEQPITLVFTGETYGGSVVCNRYGGEADIGDSLLTFTIGVPSAEEEGCGDRLDEIAGAYLDALPQMNEGGLEADGQRLVMNGNEIELHFERSG